MAKERELPGPKKIDPSAPAWRRPKIGLVLGGGGARGWAHLGVIDALDDLGIKPDVIAGTSIGAIVGAYLASNRYGEIRDFAQTITLTGMVKYLDVNLGRGGLIAGERVTTWLSGTFGDTLAQDLDLPFGAVATDVSTGREVWLREGALVPIIRASIALPGLFPALSYNGRWLGDGGLANPVPVSLARSMGAEFVIAVDLNSEMSPYDPPVTDHAGIAPGEIASIQTQRNQDSFAYSLLERLAQGLPEGLKDTADSLMGQWRKPQDRGPGYMEFINRSIQIMMHRITRSRLAGDPPDVLLTPNLEKLGVMEFHRAADAAEEGRLEVERNERLLEAILPKHAGQPPLK